MQSVKSDALGAVNGYIERAKKDEALKNSRFSLVTFNSDAVLAIRENLAMEAVKQVEDAEYQCTAMTPLYDAIGRGIGILDSALAKHGGRASLVIMTDGQENQSREFNHAKITALIEAKKGQGWLVTFLGEGLDVARQGMAIGAMAAHTAHFAGSRGLRASGQVVARSVARYAAALHVSDAVARAAFTPEERKQLAGKEGSKNNSPNPPTPERKGFPTQRNYLDAIRKHLTNQDLVMHLMKHLPHLSQDEIQRRLKEYGG
jgi:hypothetical protein